MALPENMIDRWARRHDPAPGERTLYWHVLMADQPEVVDLARQARADPSGLGTLTDRDAN